MELLRLELIMAVVVVGSVVIEKETKVRLLDHLGALIP